MRCTYGTKIPNLNLEELTGKIVVIEGSDGSGRSTQVKLLRDALEKEGYPTEEIGLKRSKLLSQDLKKLMLTEHLTNKTLSLLYATDFIDQMHNIIIPALRSGFFVIADRYIYTLIARSMVRLVDEEWLKQIYSVALIPDLIFYLNLRPEILAKRAFLKQDTLNYWESGKDIEKKEDIYESFIRYQNKLKRIYSKLSKEFSFTTINGELPVADIHKQIYFKIKNTDFKTLC